MSDTTVTVVVDDTLTGLVTCWSSGLVVYVDQPERPRVTDSGRFAALERDWSGTTTRFDTQVTETAYDAATRVLDTFDAHPDTPQFLRDARQVRAQESLAAADRLADWTAEQVANLTDLLDTIRTHRDAVAVAVATPDAPIPTADELRTHPALRR